jgi:hypothetical protein
MTSKETLLSTSKETLLSTSKKTLLSTSKETLLSTSKETLLPSKETLLSASKETLPNNNIYIIYNNNIYNNFSDKKENIYRQFDNLSLSEKEFEKLNKFYKKEDIDSVLDAIENYRNNKKYKKLYLTALTWLKNKFKEKRVFTKNLTLEEARKYRNNVLLDKLYEIAMSEIVEESIDYDIFVSIYKSMLKITVDK